MVHIRRGWMKLNNQRVSVREVGMSSGIDFAS